MSPYFFEFALWNIDLLQKLQKNINKPFQLHYDIFIIIVAMLPSI